MNGFVKRFQKKDAILPPKISLKPKIDGIFYNAMPVIIPHLNVAGVKEVNRYPAESQVLDNQILLYDLQNGDALALIYGNWITGMRTGTVATHSIKFFAVKDFSTLGFIRLGNTARATLLTLLSLYPDRNFKIKLKTYKNQHDFFIKRFSKFNNIHFICCSSTEEVIKDSDVIVSSVTVFKNDICSDECIKPGALVVPIHTRSFTNCDLFFDKVYADGRGHVNGFKNFNKFKSISEISVLLLLT